MSNDIVPLDVTSSVEVYDRITDPLTAIKTLGQSIFRSGILDRKSTRLNSSHIPLSRMPSSA